MKSHYTRFLLLGVLVVLIVLVGIYFHKGISKTYSVQKAETKVVEQEKNSEEHPITLTFVGDIILSRFVHKRLVQYGNEGSNAYAPFQDEEIRNRLSSSDLAVANLESPFGSGGPHDRISLLFNADTQYVDRLSNAGFDIVSTANNHALDQGSKGVSLTQGTLTSAGISFIGTNTKEDMSLCHKGEIKEVKGKKIGFLAYSYTGVNSSGKPIPSPPVCDWMDFETVKEDVITLQKSTDYLVVLVHSGTENSTEPSLEDEQKFKKLVDVGATLVIGAHPHVVQRVEKYKNGILAYSLGNFVFDQVKDEEKKSFMLQVILKKGGIDFATIPIHIENLCCPVLEKSTI